MDPVISAKNSISAASVYACAHMLRTHYAAQSHQSLQTSCMTVVFYGDFNKLWRPLHGLLSDLVWFSASIFTFWMQITVSFLFLKYIRAHFAQAGHIFLFCIAPICIISVLICIFADILSRFMIILWFMSGRLTKCRASWSGCMSFLTCCMSRGILWDFLDAALVLLSHFCEYFLGELRAWICMFVWKFPRTLRRFHLRDNMQHRSVSHCTFTESQYLRLGTHQSKNIQSNIFHEGFQSLMSAPACVINHERGQRSGSGWEGVRGSRLLWSSFSLQETESRHWKHLENACRSWRRRCVCVTVCVTVCTRMHVCAKWMRAIIRPQIVTLLGQKSPPPRSRARSYKRIHAGLGAPALHFPLETHPRCRCDAFMCREKASTRRTEHHCLCRQYAVIFKPACGNSDFSLFCIWFDHFTNVSVHHESLWSLPVYFKSVCVHFALFLLYFNLYMYLYLDFVSVFNHLLL